MIIRTLFAVSTRTRLDRSDRSFQILFNQYYEIKFARDLISIFIHVSYHQAIYIVKKK